MMSFLTDLLGTLPHLFGELEPRRGPPVSGGNYSEGWWGRRLLVSPKVIPSLNTRGALTPLRFVTHGAVGLLCRAPALPVAL